MITFAQIISAMLSIPLLGSGCFEVLEARSWTNGLSWSQFGWGLCLIAVGVFVLTWASHL